MWLTRRHRPAILGLAILGLQIPGLRPVPAALAETPPPPYPATLALRGFDAVTYFLDDGHGPRPGRAAFELSWRGRGWRFASAANREVFRRDPEIYAPRLGGHDPVAMAEGRIVDADPLVFARLAGEAGERLYLFRNAETLALVRARPALVEAAEARWPALRTIRDPGFRD